MLATCHIPTFPTETMERCSVAEYFKRDSPEEFRLICISEPHSILRSPLSLKRGNHEICGVHLRFD